MDSPHTPTKSLGQKKGKCWTRIVVKKDPRSANKICFICMRLARTETWPYFWLFERGPRLINGQSEFE